MYSTAWFDAGTLKTALCLKAEAPIPDLSALARAWSICNSFAAPVAFTRRANGRVMGAASLRMWAARDCADKMTARTKTETKRRAASILPVRIVECYWSRGRDGWLGGDSTGEMLEDTEITPEGEPSAVQCLGEAHIAVRGVCL